MAAGASPEEYRLRLEIDPDGAGWTGTVEFDVAPGTGPLTLDAVGLAVDRVTIGEGPVEFRRSEADGTVAIDVPPTAAGPVRIGFRGRVSTQTLNGMYRSRHGDGTFLTTQCEPTGAREIFPCVDRPDRRARIRLTVVTDDGVEAISNQPVAERRAVGGRVEWRFEATPPMATYLFYLGIGRFDRLEGKARRATVRVLTPPGRSAAGARALAAGVRLLDAFEEYYAVPYPLPKLDLIAVEELGFGGMENWGAITFQTDRLLIDAASSSFAARDVFETVCHEIAHQWFGDLVTMRWWTDIWLNESFAAFLETKICDRLEPTLDVRADFFLRVAGMAAAIDGDSLRSTHPVRTPVERPDEIGQIFDDISYGKGSTILGMLEAYLGEEPFRAGVTDYLRRFRNGNAETDDLWRSLERTSAEPVRAIAGPWIDRPGLPLITVRPGADGLELTQQRFSYLGSTVEPPWPIPIVADLGGRRERIRFDTARRTVAAPGNAVVHLNPGAVGFYRVRYDRTLYDRLLPALVTRPGPDRWIVLEDLSAFLASGDVGWATYARFAETLGGDSDRLSIESIAGTLLQLALDFPELSHVQAAARRFFRVQSERLGEEKRPGEPAADGVLRERISFGRTRIDPEYGRAVSARFSEWHRVDPDLRLATAVGYARFGGTAGYRELRSALERATHDADRSRLIRSLAWIADAEQLRESLDFAVSGGTNRSFLPRLIVQAALNPAGRPVVWPWFADRAGTLAELFHGTGALPLVLEYALPSMGLGRLDEVRAHFDAHPLPDGSRGLAKGLERIEVLERLRRNVRDPNGPPLGAPGIA